MTNYAHGHEAEAHAAAYLEKQGYEIIEQNWRTRYCEIDVVARKGKTIYFVEVKYRQHTGQGYGMDYITPQKLRRMGFAAEVWVQARQWRGGYSLAALEVTGENFWVTGFLTEL